MLYKVGIHWALLAGVPRRPDSATCPGKGSATEAAGYVNVLDVAAVAALDVEFSRLGRHYRGTNDDTRYPDQPGDCKGVEITDGNIFGVGV